MSTFTDDVMDTARLIAGCVEEDGDCATHEPCAWPCRSQAVERIARLVADRERAAAARALREAYDPVWDPSVPPGGFVCNICRFPVESEPCADHGPDEDDELEAGEGRG